MRPKKVERTGGGEGGGHGAKLMPRRDLRGDGAGFHESEEVERTGSGKGGGARALLRRRSLRGGGGGGYASEIGRTNRRWERVDVLVR